MSLILITAFDIRVKHVSGFSHCSDITFFYTAACWSIGWDCSVKDTSNYTNNFLISFTSWKWGNEHLENFVSIRCHLARNSTSFIHENRQVEQHFSCSLFVDEILFYGKKLNLGRINVCVSYACSSFISWLCWNSGKLCDLLSFINP